MSRMNITIGLLLAATFLLAGGLNAPVYALLAGHDCSFCHDLHGAAGSDWLLNDVAVEAVCLSCHAVDIDIDTLAAAVHNPLGRASNQTGYITCRECHDPHDNFININGNTNIKLVGIRFDPVTGQKFTTAKIRQETGTALGAYLDVTFDDRTDFNIPGALNTQRGACEVCHSGNHRAGQICTECHDNSTRHRHFNGFMP